MQKDRRELRVAVVGCGQIADAHFKEIQKISDSRVVAACDTYMELAERARAVYRLEHAYDNLALMLDEAKPDVVHITTPAATHREIALQCLSNDSHIYVEKPFTLDAEEAEEIYDVANGRGLKVCVGHNELFDPVWLRVRKEIQSGNLGNIIHIDSVQGFDMSGPFGAAIAADKSHWVRSLPGGIFQNTISHPVYKITDCLPGWAPRVRSFSFARDENMDVPTELRVEMEDKGVTARLFVSSGARPVERYVRIHGEHQSIEVDFDGQYIRSIRPITARGPFVSMQVPIRHMGSSFRALFRSLWNFARNDIHFFYGMNNLFRDFYDSIRSDSVGPISPEETIRVTKIMDNIFAAESTGDGAGWLEW